MEMGYELISRRGELIFARKRDFFKILGCFSLFGCVFRVLGGVLMLLGVFSRFAAIYFARSAIFFGLFLHFNCSLTKNRLVLTSFSLDFARLGTVPNRAG